jgi:hypothetical protein
MLADKQRRKVGIATTTEVKNATEVYNSQYREAIGGHSHDLLRWSNQKFFGLFFSPCIIRLYEEENLVIFH